MDTGQPARDSRRWVGRPWFARVLRVSVYLIPFVGSIVFAFMLSAIVPPAATWPIAIIRLIVIAACSTVVLYGVDRTTRRMLPLAALLDLTLVFPDEAPSRFKIALRTGGTRELQDRLVEYRQVGADEPARAAELLLGLVAELSKHDRLTRGHSERVRAYSQMIGDELGLDESELDGLRWAALLHDVGKLEVPSGVLNKPGRLNDEEFEVVKLHPEAGAALTAPLAGWLGDALRAVGEHHERWDGDGYPNGLARHEIALSARIVSVADTFDVMTSVRSYQQAGSAARAREELADCAGAQFDPAVVRAFLSISLGKLRMAMGPLSWLTQLSLFPSGIVTTTAAPAMTATAGFVAATIGAVAGPADITPVEQPVYLSEPAPIAAPPPVTDAATTLVWSVPSTTGAPIKVQVVVPSLVEDETDDRPAATSTIVVTTTSPVSTGTSAPTATSSPGTIPTTVTSSPITTTAPAPSTVTTAPSATTTVPTTTVPTTTSTSTTVPKTTTTTVPKTTTTTVPKTTTTTEPKAAVDYFLAASAAGDVPAPAVLPLVTRGPLNATLPNLDTNHDDEPGDEVKKNGTLSEFESGERLQRFSLDSSAQIVLEGPARLVLHTAAKNLTPERVAIAVALADCGDEAGTCTVFDSATVEFDSVMDRYSPVTIDFGHQAHKIEPDRHLELWVTAPMSSDQHLWMAYDTIGYESYLRLSHS